MSSRKTIWKQEFTYHLDYWNEEWNVKGETEVEYF